MLKSVLVFVLSLLALVPVCMFTGYAIGHLIAPFVYPVPMGPDTYKVDRELFAGIYGIMFIGGALYALSAAFAVLRLVKAMRVQRP